MQSAARCHCEEGRKNQPAGIQVVRGVEQARGRLKTDPGTGTPEERMQSITGVLELPNAREVRRRVAAWRERQEGETESAESELGGEESEEEEGE